MTAQRFGKGRMALIGEASHAFPAHWAQGLNLSLRDIMALCDLLGLKRDHDGPQAVGKISTANAAPTFSVARQASIF